MRKSPFALLSLVLLCCAARAQDTTPISRTGRSILQATEQAAVQPSGFNRADHMTGDWGGYRDEWQNEGVEFFGFYNSIFNGNVSGGASPHHFTYDDDLWIGVKLNLEKLIDWRGGQLVLSMVNRDGTDLTNRYIHSIYSEQQLVGGQRTFLYQAFLQQKFNDQLTLKLGRFGASDDFNTSPFYGYSLNNGINGNIRNVLFDTRFSAYPFSTWAGAILYDPTPELEAKLGLFQVTRDMFVNNQHDLNFGVSGSDGFLAIAQFGWSPQFFQRASPPPKKAEALAGPAESRTAPALKGMPGHYWLGASFSHWADYPRFLGGHDNHSYGGYLHADQMIYQEAPGSDRGLYAFTDLAYYPQRQISIVPFQLNFGLNYKGLFPHRGDDRTLVYFIYGDISEDYAVSVQTPTGHRAESEKIVEVAHRFQITPWSYVQPDLQLVIDPGGTGDIPNAVVLGAQMGVTF